MNGMVRIEDRCFVGWGCVECAWAFNPAGPPVGESLGEMMQNFITKRDVEFAAHVCAEHSGTPGKRRTGAKNRMIPASPVGIRVVVAQPFSQSRRLGNRKRLGSQREFTRFETPRD